MSKLIIPKTQDLSEIGGIIKGAKDYNAPLRASKMLIIPVSQVNFYQTRINEDPNYFKDLGIRFIKVLKDEDFGRFLQAKLQREGVGIIPDAEIIQSLGLTVNQNIQTF